jgi:hypothetical protein
MVFLLSSNASFPSLLTGLQEINPAAKINSKKKYGLKLTGGKNSGGRKSSMKN